MYKLITKNLIFFLKNKDWPIIHKLWITDLSYVKKTGVVKMLVERFLKYGSTKKELRADRLFHFFHSQFLQTSAKLGLFGDINNFGLVGDGTPVETARCPRSKPTCDCRVKGLTKCNHPRKYSRPDCNSGWDSSREKYFNGYHLYMLSTSDSHYDLPLYPKLNPASRHDSISLLTTLNEFTQRYTINSLDRILLDAAHDAEAIYELLNHSKSTFFKTPTPKNSFEIPFISSIYRSSFSKFNTSLI